MPRTQKTEEVEEVESNGSKAFRLSISLDPSLRRHIRIAAAYHDMSVGEWASAVLERAADKATQEQGDE